MTYFQCFSGSQVVAYAPKLAEFDHVFVYKCSNPTDEPAEVSLTKLVRRWSGQSLGTARRRSRGVTPRSIFFCQKFDVKTVQSELAKIDSFEPQWGTLAYWRTSSFKGEKAPDANFPDGQVAEIVVGDISVMFEGKIPLWLDDFTISVDASENALRLGFTEKTKCTIRRKIQSEMAKASKNELILSLGSRKGFVAGAVGVTTEWPKDRSADHPLRMVGFIYQTGEKPTGPRPIRCEVWRSQLADEVVTKRGDVCTVALDPRDAFNKPYWLAGEANSRVDFGETELRSSFFGTRGERFHLNAEGIGTARLGFIVDRLRINGDITGVGEVIFHPEGPFRIVHDQLRGRTRRAVGSHDLILGAAATEFIDLEGVTHLHFEKGKPAFLKPYTDVPDKSILDDKGGKVITSFLSFVKGKSGIAAVDFHSQPADAPLFEDQKSDEHLDRRRTSDKLAEPIPTFPFAGFGEKNLSSILRHEATHLSTWRRLQTKARFEIRDANTEVGVTPQGLLAEVSKAGDYQKLYFGNSDSLEAHPEFSISIGQTPLNQEFQRVLNGGQLFLVFDRPDLEALKLIQVEAAVRIRNFEFSVRLDSQKRTKADADEPAVLIVKYFKDRSLNELLKDTTTWGFKKFLAPNDSERVLRLLHEGADLSKPIPKNLEDTVLNDPNWQGVLMLHLVASKMPSAIEALRPGIVGNNLHVHHFGLNIVPVQKTDLSASAPPRFCPAFGLISYTKPAQDPDPPTPSDEEPVEAGKPMAPNDRRYRFVVQSLRVGFSNSQISEFEADINVAFSHLFWEECTTGRGKNKANADILLKGNYERRVTPDNRTEDVFSLKTDKKYEVTFPKDSFLESLTIKNAQLSVISATSERIRALIGIDADLKMKKDKPKIPLLKVKAIHLTNFGFEIDYTYNPKKFGFGLKSDGIGADVEFASPTGLSSILESLPVKFNGMSVAISNLLDLKSLGFEPIGGIGDVGTLFHFGLRFEVDFGSLGALAGDLRGLRLPLIAGWRGGASPGVAFGIQFPKYNGKLDIGIQKFIRLRAKELAMTPCPETGNRDALAIRASDVKIMLLGKEFPDSVTSFAIFLKSAESSRKVSWALGVTPSTDSAIKYVGAGQRLDVLQGSPINVKDIVNTFQKNLEDGTKVCEVIKWANPALEGWTAVANFTVSGVEVWLAVSDAQQVYGLVVKLPTLGEIDVLYRRVSNQLGIFSAEYTLSDGLRTIQAGAASIRLPAFRLEVHTDGGFLIDVGFPWKNDFSRSCQVEVAIYVGSGGFYLGRTSALASEMLQFPGGYGFLKPDDEKLFAYKVLRFGFAARVGVGRSFSIGILNANVSLTIFGGIEGAAGFVGGAGMSLNPTLYALRGYVGLMLDIEASVDFPIIKARARLLAYAMVGLELRRVLAKKEDGKHYLVKLPLVVFAEVGIRVEVDVEISVGCVSVTIHLEFSATLRLEQQLSDLEWVPAKVSDRRKTLALPGLTSVNDPVKWIPDYRHWKDDRNMNLFVTVVPCMADARDVDESEGYRTCAVGQMLLQMDGNLGGLSDLAQFLAGWILSSDMSQEIKPTTEIKLATVTGLRKRIQEVDNFWTGFGDLLTVVVAKQFKPILQGISKARNSDDAFVSIPFWPSTVFRYLPKQRGLEPIVARAHFVTDTQNAVRGDEASFTDYSRCVIAATLASFQQLIVEFGSSREGDDAGRNDPERFLTWDDIWTYMLNI